MKHILSFALFALLFAIMEIATAAAPIEYGDIDNVLAQDWLDAYEQQYYPSDSPAARSLVARDVPEAVEEPVSPAQRPLCRTLLPCPVPFSHRLCPVYVPCPPGYFRTAPES